MAGAAPTVVVRVPCQVLVLAVRCALTQRSHDVALVTRVVRDQADQLPAETLRELDHRIAYWLDEHPDAARFDVEPWRTALLAVRRARAGAR